MNRGLQIMILAVLLGGVLWPGVLPAAGSAPGTPAGRGHSTASEWAWTTTTVDAPGNVGQYTDLVLDADSRPHISYYGSGDLKYAYLDGATWVAQTIDSAGDVGLFTSIAYYGAGNVAVSYYDATNGDLKYWSGGGPVTVDSTGNVGQYTALALDALGAPRISYYDATNGNLKYVQQGTGGWELPQIVDGAGGDVGRYTALALQPSGPWTGYPAIAYYDVTNGDLKYAVAQLEPRAAAGPEYWWSISVVDSLSDVGRWTTLAFDSQGYPHILYAAASGANLKHAWQTAGDAPAWHYEVVAVDTLGHSSLALDDQDRLHVSYWQASHLVYAYHDGVAWHYETVDAAGDVGADNALALDGNGYPHLSYRDDTNMDLKYAYACCAAQFTVAPQPQCVAQPVQFANYSRGAGAPFTYLWAFGDGATSTAISPTHAYTTAGVYTTWLTVTAGCGFDTLTTSVVISGTPEAGFTLGPTPVCAGTTTVQFTNTTVGSPTLTYLWDFDDGGSSTLVHPTHTFALAGNYEVVLLAANGCGLDPAIQIVPAHGAPQQVTPTWTPPVVEVGHVVTFTGQASSTLPVVDWAWDWGDGSRGSGPVAPHTYATTGTYPVLLTATNGCAAGQGQAEVVVTCRPVTATALAWMPVTPTVGWPATFTATAGGTAPPVYAWDFGDGHQGAGAVVSHTYAATGTYTVALAATNYCGAQTVQETVAVIALPAAVFTSNTPVCLGAALVFTNSSSGAAPLAFTWDFGDGQTATETNPLHTYTQAGPYTVQLTATNAYGQDRMAAPVAVESAPASATFTFAPAAPAPGAVVTFTAVVSGGYPAAQLQWDLGDGTRAAGPVVTHTYWPTGTYLVLLEAGGRCGIVTATQDVPVAFCAQPAGLTVAHSTPLVAGEAAVLTATLTAGSAPLTYAWDFGDSSPPVYGPAVVTHTYPAAGVYTLSVAVWNNCGVLGPLGFPVQVARPTHRVYLPLVFKSYYPGDVFEPDDAPAQANLLGLASPQGHDFTPAGDEDWVYLDLAAGTTYRFQTRDLAGGADTRLFLYQPGAYDTPLAGNDDWAAGNCGGPPPDPKASCFTYTPTTSGRYELQVDQYEGGAVWGPAVRYTVEATQP